MDDFYSNSSLTREEKIVGREDVIDQMQELFVEDYLPLMSDPQMYGGVATAQINNAAILSYRRYHRDLGLFEQVYDALSGNFPQLLGVLSQAAGAPNPYSFLAQWLSEN